ncbi:unnamed protein product, partial [Gongylonema pulchrum]|uniref:DUF5675 domain-containing protein n=1 Tax=Gongylonema pulchrum TaxID=637853 RepID=A0A183DGK8_9BILA
MHLMAKKLDIATLDGWCITPNGKPCIDPPINNQIIVINHGLKRSSGNQCPHEVLLTSTAVLNKDGKHNFESVDALLTGFDWETNKETMIYIITE